MSSSSTRSRKAVLTGAIPFEAPLPQRADHKGDANQCNRIEKMSIWECSWLQISPAVCNCKWDQLYVAELGREDRAFSVRNVGL
jgi:hypothetical protein